MFADQFAVSVDDVSPEFQLELIDLQSSDEMRASFRDNTLIEFYKSLPQQKFVNLKDNALVHASIFGSIYRCEQTFSQMKLNKSSTRNQLSDAHLEDVLRSSTNIQPDISKLIADMQPQPSH